MDVVRKYLWIYTVVIFKFYAYSFLLKTVKIFMSTIERQSLSVSECHVINKAVVDGTLLGINKLKCDCKIHHSCKQFVV